MPSLSLPPLIVALLDARRYPDPASAVELIETHASWLLLAGHFVYKIKKSIALPFLDYSTLDKRRLCCEAELRLNRRFAPAIYLSVVPITGTAEDPCFGGIGKPIEYAVKMRRFDETGRLDHLCQHGQLDASLISGLAETLARFQARAAVASSSSPFGEAEQLLPPALENFDELGELLPEHGQHWARLAEWTRAEFARCAVGMRVRKAVGKVREGHGDLHLGNLVLINRKLTLFDCIEFADYLRWIDVANDIAFTYVDLLAQRQAGLAGWLLNEWLSVNGDYQAMNVFRFYAVYRALVLAKVKAIHARQAQRDCPEADSYLSLAERLIAPPPPRLIITHGVAGCGKSRATRKLLLNDAPPMCIRLRSDVERKRLFGFSAEATTRSAIDGGIYASEASERTYEKLYQIAGDLLSAGWSVIVDAAFLERRRRDAFRALACATAAEFAIVAPQATVGQLRTRIQRRLSREHDASEATLAVLERQFERIEHLSDEERTLLLPVDRRLPRSRNVPID